MYTMGTSQLRWIAQQQPSAIQSMLQNKLVAYVGSAAERTATGQDQIAMGPSVVFFQITQTPTVSIDLFECVLTNGLWTWSQAGSLPGPALVLQQLQMASGWTNYIFAIQRGDTQSLTNALTSDGVMFYDKQKSELWIYNGSIGKWESVLHGREPGLIIRPGMMIGWSNGLPVPDGFLRCNGNEVNIGDYPQLYAVVGYVFGTPSVGGKFVLPNQSNTIISIASAYQPQ